MNTVNQQIKITIKKKIKNFFALALIVLAVWQCPRATAQTPLSNLVFAVGTTWRDSANQEWSYVLLSSVDNAVLAGQRFGVFGKPGNAGSPNPFTQRGTWPPNSIPLPSTFCSPNPFRWATISTR